MKIENDVSDDAALREIGHRLARCRLNRNLTQAAVADEAGVSKRTIVRVEQGHSTQSTNLLRILRALQLLDNLEVLIPASTVSPIQQFKMQGKTRKRASSPSAKTRSASPWSWGNNE